MNSEPPSREIAAAILAGLAVANSSGTGPPSAPRVLTYRSTGVEGLGDGRRLGWAAVARREALGDVV
ncbi:MAG: hypothetical protein GIW99_07700 [Candidatus Eremiobacteraeota bacterium]|nr:hypothetical protein [Candidatus Eremiobacteraeota bacterium]MBC5827546.1 hypothetical protein [Candidatus Eremiobacteraeota bacterium]